MTYESAFVCHIHVYTNGSGFFSHIHMYTYASGFVSHVGLQADYYVWGLGGRMSPQEQTNIRVV